MRSLDPAPTVPLVSSITNLVNKKKGEGSHLAGMLRMLFYSCFFVMCISSSLFSRYVSERER